MTDLLSKNTVLVLNRNWQAIHVSTPADAFCQMASNTFTALDIEGEGRMKPVVWSEWVKLPVRDGDQAVRTPRGLIRIPTVVIATRFASVPRRRPRLTPRAIRERDGNRCQYTGRTLQPGEGSLDHVIPKSRGGRDTWENLVWAAREVNHRKGNRLPQEAGLRLLTIPTAPKEVPVTFLLRNPHGVSDWRWFIGC